MAGSVKPNAEMIEASYSVLGGLNNDGSYNASTNNGLFNQNAANSAGAPHAWYWHNSAAYIEIEINDSFKIWRAGQTTWISLYNKLKTLKWNGSSYDDITDSQPATSAITESQWEATSSVLQAGRYRFEYNAGTGTRIDSEWFIEQVIIAVDKYLILDGVDIYTISNGDLSVVGATPLTEVMFTDDGMDDLTGITKSHLDDLTAPQILYYKV
jgi:hypothetical protein